jgi:N-methylhydantoinase B
MAGGDGFGHPFERNAERVAADVRHGIVTAALARQQYGVALHDDGRVDEGETAALRSKTVSHRRLTTVT